MKDYAEQKTRSIMVVDHDLLFLDYISDELMVFDGVPAKEGEATGPFSMNDGMNNFLDKIKYYYEKRSREQIDLE